MGICRSIFNNVRSVLLGVTMNTAERVVGYQRSHSEQHTYELAVEKLLEKREELEGHVWTFEDGSTLYEEEGTFYEHGDS